MTDKSIPTWADLEEGIFESWAVVTDLRNAAKHTSDEKSRRLLDSLAEVYDFKFNHAWDIYETLTPEYYAMKKELRDKDRGPRPTGHKWDIPEF